MLKLYNTMSRRTEAFTPRDTREVKMFTCGPSIYQPPHLGNYRTFLWEDVLQRYLEYLGYPVARVINLTDVEDKAIQQAEKEGKTLADLTGGVSVRFFEEAASLRIRLPAHIPRSSTSVEQAVHLIEILLAKGIAYRHGGDIFYDPLKFEGFGKLFRLDMSRWPKERRRFRKDTYPGRRWNLGDFILWHGHKEGSTIYWDSEIGRGRPSWNIQDPAIITKHLGYTIDISCGGVDNLYRHHDYNIAVIEGVSGKEFSRYWVHGAHLLVNGKKMSKSLGNILYPLDLEREGYSTDQVRFYLLYGRHGETMNFTWKGVKAAAARLDHLRCGVDTILKAMTRGSENSSEWAPGRDLILSFESHMNRNLDVKGTVDALSEVITTVASRAREQGLRPREKEEVREALERMDEVLQFIFPGRV